MLKPVLHPRLAARRHALRLIGGTALAALSGLAAATASIGQAAPDFSASTADGKTLDLKSLRGKTVVLEWTNHDCPYVKKHYRSGNIPQQQQEAAAQGVVWLQIISSAPATQGHVDGATALRLNTERSAKPAAVLLDPSGQIGRLYGARTTPHMYVITPEGRLAYAGGIDSIPSARDEDIARADQFVRLALADLRAGKPVGRSSSQAYGCSIKYASNS